MTMGMRRLAMIVGILLLTMLVTEHAEGFFPKGGFNLNQQLRYAIWPFREFDTDNNGMIEANEGLEFRIEGGKRGFTPFEMDQVKAAFQTWQDVPTSYAAFRFAGIIEDPIVPGISAPDYLPTIFMQVTELAPNDGYGQLDDVAMVLPEVTGPLAAVTLVLYAIDMTALPVAGNTVIVSAGTIIDCDIIVNASLHRSGLPGTSNTFGALDLQATMVSATGLMLGLSPTPLNNLQADATATQEDAVVGLPLESVALQFTGTDGISRMIGATPTMFPLYFLTEDESGNHSAGWRDLAPDDISGVSWLYPREDGLENFFSISHEARTHVRKATGIPPAPISGAHIVAWANVTGSESARRVPLFSTMSGLYEKYTNTQLTGWFMMMGLWKQLEVPGKAGELFTPSYVLTMNPLTGLGYEKQSPPGVTAGTFDSIQGAFPASVSTIVRPETEFTTNYPSEVFNEDGNIYGIDNNMAGTPLAWSFIKNAVVSKVSDKTLPRMLPRNVPMFGDPDVVCPMNIIENAEGALPTENIVVARVNNKLRDVRDDVLLRSAFGTALVDLYYQAAPWLAGVLKQHAEMTVVARKLVLAGVWMGERKGMSVLVLLVLGVLLAGLVRRSRVKTAGAVVAGVLVLLLAVSAHAVQTPITTPDMVAQATHIVSGKVLSAEARYDAYNRIYTDVVFRVDDVAKGGLNRGSQISFSVIGGRYGSLVLAASGIPSFTTGEHALLYLVDVPGYGLVPYGGMRGKTVIYVDPETEEEEIDAAEEGEANPTPVEGEKREGETLEGENEGEPLEGENEGESTKSKSLMDPAAPTADETGRVSVRDYMHYLRSLARN